jgi:hypothetical protein
MEPEISLINSRRPDTSLNLNWKSVIYLPTFSTIRVKVKLSLCLTNEVLHHEGVGGSGCIDPHFLELGTSWS